MGLVRDNCLIPTYDAPELGYIKESTSEQYVPDVFYKVGLSPHLAMLISIGEMEYVVSHFYNGIVYGYDCISQCH